MFNEYKIETNSASNDATNLFTIVEAMRNSVIQSPGIPAAAYFAEQYTDLERYRASLTLTRTIQLVLSVGHNEAVEIARQLRDRYPDFSEGELIRQVQAKGISIDTSGVCRHALLSHPAGIVIRQQLRDLENGEQPRRNNVLGDRACIFSANSPLLRCAVNPEGPCEGCQHFENA